MENSNIKRGMDLEASEEFRLLMAYTSRRSVRGALSRESTLLKKTNMKKKMGKLEKIFSCLQFHTESSEQPDGERCRQEGRVSKDVVGKVSKIVESLHIAPSDIESDSNDGELLFYYHI
ncbi:apoptosis facilitator Bcl-2-like protein 14 [Arapaima gigas]